MNYQILDVTTGKAFVPAKLYTYFLDNSPEIDSKRTRPAIVLCPGGGYRFTSDREAEAVAMQFLAAGKRDTVDPCYVLLSGGDYR